MPLRFTITVCRRACLGEWEREVRTAELRADYGRRHQTNKKIRGALHHGFFLLLLFAVDQVGVDTGDKDGGKHGNQLE